MTRDRKTRKLTPKEIRESTEAAAQQLQEQKPKVNFVSSWLAWRYDKNGFGDDFELTLVPKEAT